jgi:hypothetical protein
MKRFTVNWIRRALNQLAAIWTASIDRDAVTAAAALVDSELAIEPATKGKPRGARFRTFRAPSMVVLFQVLDPDCRVDISSVKRISDSVIGRTP